MGNIKNGDLVTWNSKSWMVLRRNGRRIVLVEPGNPSNVSHVNANDVVRFGPWR